MNFDDIMNAYRSNRERFDELKELCDKDLIIPFVGAGMSMPTYPSWRKELKYRKKRSILSEPQMLNKNMFSIWGSFRAVSF